MLVEPRLGFRGGQPLCSGGQPRKDIRYVERGGIEHPRRNPDRWFALTGEDPLGKDVGHPVCQ
jgi:hypothetical protein